MPRKIQVPDDIDTLSDLVRHMVYASGKSGTQVSREIGRSDNYLWSMLRNGTMPGVDLFAAIVKACGYTITIEGPAPSNPETFVLVSDEHGGLSVWLTEVLGDFTDDSFTELELPND